jgi:hypothetical protein
MWQKINHTYLKAQEMNISPPYLLLPLILSVSLAFMLPVATPTNALIFANGSVRMKDMVNTCFKSKNSSRQYLSSLFSLLDYNRRRDEYYWVTDNFHSCKHMAWFIVQHNPFNSNKYKCKFNQYDA